MLVDQPKQNADRVKLAVEYQQKYGYYQKNSGGAGGGGGVSSSSSQTQSSPSSSCGVKPLVRFLVDPPEQNDPFMKAYSPWPLRLYLVGADGTLLLVPEPRHCSFDHALATLVQRLRALAGEEPDTGPAMTLATTF